MKSRKVSLSVLIALGLFTLFSFGIYSCKKDDNKEGTAKVGMHLTDGPSLYDAVYLNIKQIEVNTKGGWNVLTPARPGFYDILTLNNGLDTLLGHYDIPAGRINQIRLILGDGNYVVVNGIQYPLNTPSAEESGLKLNIHETLEAGGSYEIWIDFDAARSIVQTGNGGYILKPVIRAYGASTNGKITGYVLPDSAQIIVYAIMGNDSFSAIPNPDGYFAITGLEAGTYQVSIDAQNNAYQDQIKNNVQVSFGVNTNIGTVVLTTP